MRRLDAYLIFTASRVDSNWTPTTAHLSRRLRQSIGQSIQLNWARSIIIQRFFYRVGVQYMTLCSAYTNTLGHIISFLDVQTPNTIIVFSTISRRFDYCNSLMTGVIKYSLPLQSLRGRGGRYFSPRDYYYYCYIYFLYVLLMRIPHRTKLSHKVGLYILEACEKTLLIYFFRNIL